MPRTAAKAASDKRFRRFRPILSMLWQTACGVGVGVLGALARTQINRVLPGTEPYLLLAPTVLLSTLLAGWRAGLLTTLVALFLTWILLLRPAGFSFFSAGDDLSFALQALSCLLVVFVAQSFRTMSRRALEARAEQAAQRDLLFRELDHRVKNMLALFSSMVDLQRRRAAEPAAQAALQQVATRLQSIVAAHGDLYRDDQDVSKVDLVGYLNELCRHLSSALFADASAQLQTDFSGQIRIDRDRAVAIGLIVNELVTNAAKHARGADALIVRASLACAKSRCTLTIADNGPGLRPESEAAPRDGTGGMGRGLIAAFLQQAEAELSSSDDGGARFDLTFRV